MCLVVYLPRPYKHRRHMNREPNKKDEGAIRSIVLFCVRASLSGSGRWL